MASNLHRLPPERYALPDYHEHAGRTVVWEPWQPSARVMCLGTRECERCSSTATPLFSAARAQPHPGETFTTVRERSSGHVPGGAYKQVKVPAWAVYSLCAFRCPDCSHVDVLDVQDGYKPVDTSRPTLF